MRLFISKSTHSEPAGQDAVGTAGIGLQHSNQAAGRRRFSVLSLALVFVIGIGAGWFAAAQWGPMAVPSGDAHVSAVADAEVSPAAQAADQSTPRPSTLIRFDGMYRVGTDLAPGRYVATGAGSACYYATVADLSGSLRSVITTHFGDAWGRRVELRDGEYFETDACGTWVFEAAVDDDQ